MASEPTFVEYVTAVSSVVSTIAVVVGLYYGYRQITVWRIDARARRRAEVAEEVLAASYSAGDVISSLRSRLSQVPVDEIENRAYVYEQRWDRMSERSSVFENLRHAQIKAKAVLQSEKTEEAIEAIYKVRNEFLLALEFLAEFAREENPSREETYGMKEFRQKVFGSFDEQDVLNNQLKQALSNLDTELGPTIRLEREG